MTNAGRVSTALGVVLAVAIAAYGVYLLAVGTQVTITPAGLPGAQPQPGTTEYMPDPAGLFPLVTGLTVAAGLLLRAWVIIVLGAAGIGLFSVLFVFGVGGVLLPAWLLLVFLLTLAWLAERRVA
jgi:hypothetical protein